MIYGASKSHNAWIWISLRSKGVPINATWIDEAGEGHTVDWENLWERCIAEAMEADALILYVDPGDVLTGALVEVGAALGAGNRVLVVGEPGFRFAAHPLVSCHSSIDEALSALTEGT